jgi:RNA recognition motif. (a.k.a. RRM, RBD, or RNP domain)
MNIDVPLDDLVLSNGDSAPGDGDRGSYNSGGGVASGGGGGGGGGYSRRPIVVRDLETGAVHTVGKDGRQGVAGSGVASGRYIASSFVSRGSGGQMRSGRRPIVVRDPETGEVRTAGDTRAQHGGSSHGSERNGGYGEERRHRTNPIVIRDLETGNTRVLGEDRRGGTSNGVRSGFISKRSPRRHSPTAVPEPKILIGNLHHEVNNTDIYDLFSNVGPLARALIVYDRAGNHTGRGEVTFERYEHALEAVKRYNGVPLDNRPLEITLSEDSAPVRLTTRSGRSAGRRYAVDDGAADYYGDGANQYGRSDYDRR